MASTTIPGRHFAVSRVVCFAEDQIGYREWARKGGKLEDFYSLDDRYDHDLEDLIAKHLIYLIE